MTIDLAFITYNRLDYTKLALQSVLADCSEAFSLTIWDNASTDGTRDYLKNQVHDPRVKRVILSEENVGQTAAVNRVWADSSADLLGKLDNDCILTPGWTRLLAEAHRDIPELGVVACWHFFPEDFDHQRAQHKIKRYGRHQILRHPWTCGTGLLTKRRVFEELGPMRGRATTEYWLQMAKAGYVNGFYYPLIHQEHMDDLRSKHCRQRNMSAKEQTEYRLLHERILHTLLTGPYDPAYYEGTRWLSILRRLRKRFLPNLC
jgi:GT2 family glycosyltransferase